MDEQTKKNLVIGVTVVCLFAASILFYRSFFGGSGGAGAAGDGQAALMCTSCGGFEVSMDEFREMISQQAPGAMMMAAGTVAMECPKCGKKTCYQARKCKKCETIFVTG